MKKKIIAVFIMFAMVTTMAMPALAEETVLEETQSEKVIS